MQQALFVRVRNVPWGPASKMAPSPEVDYCLEASVPLHVSFPVKLSGVAFQHFGRVYDTRV